MMYAAPAAAAVPVALLMGDVFQMIDINPFISFC